MSFRLVQELAADGVRVAVACRVLRVSTSGYYEWRGRAAVGAGCRRRGAQRADRRDPRDVARDVRRAARARRAAARPRRALRPQAGRPADARSRGCTASTAVAGSTRCPAPAGARRPGAPALRRRRPEPALAHRHHRAPDARGQGLLRGGARRVLAGASSAGRSPTTCARSSSSTRWRWRAGGAARRPARPWCTRTAARSTRPGRSATGCARPACSARWAASARPTTTR